MSEPRSNTGLILGLLGGGCLSVVCFVVGAGTWLHAVQQRNDTLHLQIQREELDYKRQMLREEVKQIRDLKRRIAKLKKAQAGGK